MSKPQDVLSEMFASGAACPRAVVYVTGGGASFLSWTCGTAGASNFLLEGRVPYAMPSSQQEMHSALKKSTSDSFPPLCSEEAAVLLARSALDRAVELQLADSEGGVGSVSQTTIGVGCSCALASTRPKKGDHRIHVAVERVDGWGQQLSVTLEKGKRSRAEEDEVAAMLILRAVLSSASAPADGQQEPGETKKTSSSDVPTGLCSETEPVQCTETNPVDALEELHAGRASSVLVCGQTGVAVRDPPLNRLGSGGGMGRGGKKLLVVPGSFNPLHWGHIQMASAAAKTAGNLSLTSDVLFELSVGNADKPSLSLEALRSRVAQFRKKTLSAQDDAEGDSSSSETAKKKDGGAGDLSVLVTHAALFREKCGLTGPASFAVGFDTYRRIVDKKYSGGTETGLLMSLACLNFAGATFVVAGREEDGVFKTLDTHAKEHPCPPEFVQMFKGIEGFRADISSTAIREKMKREQT